MIEVQLGNKTKNLPEKLTIKTYQQYIKRKDWYDEHPSHLLGLILDEDPMEIMTMDVNKIQFVLEFITSQFVQRSSNKLQERFTHNDIEYGIEKDWSKLTWGAWMDFEILSSQDVDQNIHHILSILYRPIITKTTGDYIIEDYNPTEVLKRKQIFLDLPVEIWFSSANFFFQIVKLYITDSSRSLELMMKRMNRIQRIWMKLPKFLQRRLPVDFILNLLYPSVKKTLLNSQWLKG
jgi:hypothetical protein